MKIYKRVIFILFVFIPCSLVFLYSSPKAEAQVNNAACEFWNPPTQVSAGQQFTVTIRMRNTGTTTWTQTTNITGTYELVSQDPGWNMVWGMNHQLLPYPVSPGGAADFILQVTAPSQEGDYNFNWQMAQLGVGSGFFEQAGVRVGICSQKISVVSSQSDDWGAFCPSPGNWAFISWPAVSGAQYYTVRAGASTWNGCDPSIGNLCFGDDPNSRITGTSYYFQTAPSYYNYSWWVDARTASGVVTQRSPINISCVPSFKPAVPSGLSGSCSSGGTSATISWDPVPGVSSYSLRFNNVADLWDGTCYSSLGDFCTTVTGTSYTFYSRPGYVYEWWMSAFSGGDTANDWTDSVPPHPQLICGYPNCRNLSVSSSTIVQGQAVTLQANFDSTPGELLGGFGYAPAGTNNPYGFDWMVVNPSGSSDPNSMVRRRMPLSGSSNSFSFQWTPPEARNYDIFCASWYDGRLECRGDSDYVDGHPRYHCAGPSSSTVLSVVTPTVPVPTATTVPTSTPNPCPSLVSPSNLSPNGSISCSVSMITTTISWDPVPNANWYDVRVDDGNTTVKNASGPVANNCGAGVTHDICINQWTSSQANCSSGRCSMTISLVPGISYNWWVHSGSSTACPASPSTSAILVAPGCSSPGTPQFNPSVSCLSSGTTSIVGNITWGENLQAPVTRVSVMYSSGGNWYIYDKITTGINPSGTTVPQDFVADSGNPGTAPLTLTISPSRTYVVQNYSSLNGTQSSSSFSIPLCPTSTVTPVPTSTPIPTPTPTPPACNTNIQCSGTCVANAGTDNTCSGNNGTRSNCVYTQYSGAAQRGEFCTRATAPDQPCTVDNCSQFHYCSGGDCIVHDCDSGISCTQDCTTTSYNSCSIGNGTRGTCTYTKYQNITTTCKEVSAPSTCTVDTCIPNYACEEGECKSVLGPCVKEGDVLTFGCIGVLMQKVINFLITIAGLIALLLILYSGIRYITAAGDREKIEQAKQTLTYAIIGLIVVALAFGIMRIIASITGVEQLVG